MGSNYSLVPDEDILNFGDSLGKMLSLIANASVSNNVLQFFRDQELIGALKPNDDKNAEADYRPLCMGGTLRKIIATAIFRSSKEFNDVHFQKLQYAFEKSGTEKVINVMRKTFQNRKEFDIYKIDGTNAFNSCNRTRLLFEVKKNFPIAYNFIRAMYLLDSNMWIYGFSDEIRKIIASIGLQQGCPLSSWGYAMVILPLLKKLAEILNTPLEGIIKAFVDDLTIAGSPDKMLEAIEYIKDQGKFYGYTINFNKGCYIMSKHDTFEDANNFRNRLMEMGLKNSTIKMNPLNLKENSDFLNQRYNIEFFNESHGTKLLGCHIGEQSYILKNINDYIEKFQIEKMNLIKFPHSQSRQLLLMNSFSTKINHIFRTTETELLNNLIEQFEMMQKEIFLESLEKHDIPKPQWKQCKFPIRNGGFGLSNLLHTAHSAYAASSITSYPEIMHHYPNTNYVTDNFYKSFIESIEYIKDNSSNNDLDSKDEIIINDIMNYQKNSNENTNKLQSYFYTKLNKHEFNLFKKSIQYNVDNQNNINNNNNNTEINDKNIYLTWITSLNHQISGAWLLATPKTEELIFTDNEFQTAMNIRLHLAPPFLNNDLLCNCKNNPIIDKTGHHLITGCKEGKIRQAHHTVLLNSITKIFKQCGLQTIIEEVDCFKTNDPDNNKRPDISICNANTLGFQHNKLILDISVTSPFNGTESGVLQPMTYKNATTFLKAAEMRYNQKQQKYSKIADQNNMDFKTLIFETSGNLHNEGYLLLKNVAKVGSNLRNVTPVIYLNYFFKIISSSFQKSVSQQINNRISKIIDTNPLLKPLSSLTVFDDYCGKNIFAVH
jgi:hypothetical protein